jgi:hypothetical protein
LIKWQIEDPVSPARFLMNMVRKEPRRLREIIFSPCLKKNSRRPIMSKANLGMRYDVSSLTEHDIYLFKEGNHFNLCGKLGSHPLRVDATEGVHFGVWAPNAERVSVIGDFNGWSRGFHSRHFIRDHL